MLGIWLVLLDILQQHCALNIHRFTITCDCNGAGLKSLTSHRPPTANNDNYNLRTIDAVYQWVEGHQAECYNT
jgi:hypothetical protein